MPHNEPITGKIWEVEHGWAYAVYTGDGEKPGSLCRAAAAFATADEAAKEMLVGIFNTKRMRDCEHEFNERNTCIHCHMWNYHEGPKTYDEAVAEGLTPAQEAEHYEYVKKVAEKYGFPLSDWQPKLDND